ncbi:MAG: hypothetical protein NC820_06495 [Candidatus Omnitrophica bacterium]|nr:hypothetical protein [Candidatus Omnitrophota bacterium]
MNSNNLFFQEIVNLIDKRINSFIEGYRQNLALLSNDREEISYLLNKHLSIKEYKGVVTIYINALYMGDREIYKNVVYDLLSNYLGTQNNLDSLIISAKEIIPLTTSLIRDNLGKKSISFIKVLELINRFINETSRKCIFIIEEFTNLRETYDNFHQDFSQFIMLQKMCMVILASSHIESAQKMLSTELNFLFGNFEKIFLGESNFINSYIYLKEAIKPLNPTPFLLSFFVDILGKNIIYYDIMAENIKRYNDSDEVKCTEIAIENSLYRKESYFYQKFIGIIDKLKEKVKEHIFLLRILFTLSNGYNRKKDILSLEICESKILLTKLQRLVEMGIISNFGDLYKIKDELFSFWLSHIFCFEVYPNIFSYYQKKHLFREKLCDTLKIFKESFYKDKLKRILELLNSFNDDILKLGINKLKLPYVEKTKVISYPEGKINLIIGEGKEIIFAGIKEGLVEDTDIIYYLEKASALKNKNVKRIFITLDRFTTSAKVISEQNKLLTWDNDDINNLLKIYHKPIIIDENIINF